MNRTRMSIAVVLAMVLIVGASFAANNASGYGGKHGKFGHDPFFRLIHKLDLTDAQKAQVATIIKNNEAQAKTIVTNLANARAQLIKVILSGGDVSKASDDVAGCTKEFAQFQSSIVGQIIPILTADQQTTLQNMQEKIGSKMNAMIDARFARLDKWIAKHTPSP